MKLHHWLQRVEWAEPEVVERILQERGKRLCTVSRGEDGALEMMLTDEKVEVNSRPGLPNSEPRLLLGKLCLI